ncbi:MULTISPECIES: hypothetical protein [unclassified Sphingomonas]|jgi:hypothetical protein|uniref:hypothetical protein n=1 Tax=unclassified Sphingomonas TaxID=196159 RepID=UPI00082AE34C|nr:MULTISPECIES: hypothetical protein [unclassified Sphingomonas]
MAAAGDFRFRRNGRSPLAGIALVASLGAIALTAATRAPWFLYLPMVAAAAEALRMLIVNPVTGIDIDAAGLALIDRRSRQTIRLATIDHVALTRWTDGVDVTLVLRDARRIAVSSRLLPESAVLRRELERRGVPVRAD